MALYVLLQLVSGVVSAFGPDLLRSVVTTESRPKTPAPRLACPDRVSERLSGSTSTDLVAAYGAGDNQIFLCRTDSGQVYYYGEYTGRPDTGLAMPASETPHGYIARNGAYTYEVRNGEVIITRGGSEIARKKLGKLESAS